ncbi:MAG: hypothetical protein JW734_08530 [Candidatus Omnitrophica bacterium]|nr:hypothetical protein [Candidatus Omnitrophota bacterium]
MLDITVKIAFIIWALALVFISGRGPSGFVEDKPLEFKLQLPEPEVRSEILEIDLSKIKDYEEISSIE